MNERVVLQKNSVMSMVSTSARWMNWEAEVPKSTFHNWIEKIGKEYEKRS